MEMKEKIYIMYNNAKSNSALRIEDEEEMKKQWALIKFNCRTKILFLNILDF